MNTRVCDVGEDALVALLIEELSRGGRDVLLGPGDDCAVVRNCAEGQLSVLKTDAVVAGIHFLAEDEPKRIGWKAAARVVSDFAAMGGEPRHFLITLGISGDLLLKTVVGIYKGLSQCASKYGVAIVGGETTSIQGEGQLWLNVAGSGIVEEASYVRRSGGQVGDRVLVTGHLGGSYASGWHLDFLPRLKEGQWLAQNGAHAMMDLSDGLGKDLPRLARASGCGFFVEQEHIPTRKSCSLNQALGDGEDFELLITTSAHRATTWSKEWQKTFPELRLTPIGRLTNGEPGKGNFEEGGWEHLSNTNSQKNFRSQHNPTQ